MKFFALFAACMLMVLSVFAQFDSSETKKYCPSNAATFNQCIKQYGGWSPEETTCQSKASLGDEYNRCLATAYYDLSKCFDHCPNHPRKASYDLYFQQYQPYYTARVTTEQPTGAPNQNANPLTGNQQGSDTINLDVDTSNGSTMLNAFSLGAILCMVAYWIF